MVESNALKTWERYSSTNQKCTAAAAPTPAQYVLLSSCLTNEILERTRIARMCVGASVKFRRDLGFFCSSTIYHRRPRLRTLPAVSVRACIFQLICTFPKNNRARTVSCGDRVLQTVCVSAKAMLFACNSAVQTDVCLTGSVS